MNTSAETIEQTLGISTSENKSSKKTVWVIIMIVLIGGGIGWGWWNHSRSQEVQYLSAQVEMRTLTTSVSATGNLEPTNTVDVGIEVSGTVSEVLVDYNDQVSKGQVMARLDTTKLTSKTVSSTASLASTQASIADAKATLKNAQNEWERVHSMFESTHGNYPSRQEMDNAATTVEKAKAVLAGAIAQSNQATAQLNADRDDLRKAVVVSPINGIVLERKVEPGQTVVASMQTPVLFKMAENLTKMRVIVSVDEADVGEVKEAQIVRFNVDAYQDKTFEGRITQLRLNSQILNGVVTYDAVVEVSNDSLLLRPGMTATAQIITGTLTNALSIPNAALRFTPPETNIPKEPHSTTVTKNDGSRFIWILKDKKPYKVSIKPLQSDGMFTAIGNSTLKAGDKVLIGIQENK